MTMDTVNLMTVDTDNFVDTGMCVTDLLPAAKCHHYEDDNDHQQDEATDANERVLKDVRHADRFKQLRLQLIGE